nr:hypothetical protein [Tanacetum cinerariifolium]
MKAINECLQEKSSLSSLVIGNVPVENERSCIDKLKVSESSNYVAKNRYHLLDELIRGKRICETKSDLERWLFAQSMAFKMWFMPFETACGTVVLTLEMEALFLADLELLFKRYFRLLNTLQMHNLQ